MENERIPYRNSEGYPDPTAHDALNSVQDEMEQRWEIDARIKLIVRALRAIAELGGFELADRIVLMDKKTGQIYR